MCYNNIVEFSMLNTHKQQKYTALGALLLAVLLLTAVFRAPSWVFGQSAEELNDQVKKLNDQIKNKRDRVEDIQRKQEEYNRQLKQKQAEKADLANQLDLLDNRIAKAQLDLEMTETEIDRTNLEINKTNLQISDKEVEILKEKERIGAILRLLYKSDRASSLEILLLNDSFSEFLNQVKYLEDVNGELSAGIKNLEKLRSDLATKKSELDSKSAELVKLKQQMVDSKAALDGQKEEKGFVLEQTKSSEREYQRLLAQAKQEQAAAAADIVSLEKLVRDKMSQAQKKKLEMNDTGYVWPVPKNTITATFHDPDYPFKYIFEHPAVDIRAKQGTPLKAAASGYVARAMNAGKGYSYIMLVHGDNMATVYGHVSKIIVQEDEYVVQGQIIGYSGGMPGTPGAGKLTTGAHLHFEVRQNGIPVNPLDYLP